jgi:hypothetical protein
MEAGTRFLVVPPNSGLQSVEIRGNRMVPTDSDAHSTSIYCTGVDCTALPIELVFATSKHMDITTGLQRYGLPAEAGAILALRPKTAVPSSTGDTTIIIDKIALAPAGPVTSRE